MLLGFVLGGSVAVEQAFGVPGLGRALVTAIIERDIIVVQNLVLLYAVIFVVVNVLVDLSYAWLDPAHPVQLSERRPYSRELAPVPAPPQLRCRRSAALVGLLIVLVALAAPLLAPRDPLKADFRRMNKPPDAQSLLRHRPGRPRHAEPRDLRRAHLALRGVLRGAARHHGRLAVGRGVRLPAAGGSIS